MGLGSDNAECVFDLFTRLVPVDRTYAQGEDSIETTSLAVDHGF